MDLPKLERSTVYMTKPAAEPVVMPVPLFSLHYPREVPFSLESIWSGVAQEWEVTLRLLQQHGGEIVAPQTQKLTSGDSGELRFEGTLPFAGPSTVWLILEVEGEELARHQLRIERAFGPPGATLD